MILRLVFILALTLPSFAATQELAGEYLYKVSTVRAAPGKFPELLDWIAELRTSGYFEDAGENDPFLMRHSQGDHWDLMTITPMGSWAAYYSEEATATRGSAAAAHAALLVEGAGLVAFHEDHFAFGPPLAAVKAAYDANDFFHIEMFEAVAGKANDLFEQRRMENAYLAATGQVANMIFRRAAGSDVDVFTIGFHESLETFAAPSGVSDEDKEIAAVEAGFESRSDISFYLRSLISGHHDTLAVKVE